jgi:predicted ATPase
MFGMHVRHGRDDGLYLMPPQRRRPSVPVSSTPFLTRISVPKPAEGREEEFPFTLPYLKNGLHLSFDRYVTFFAGENGSGKSTLLEAIAEKCGFNPAGGNRNHAYDHHRTESGLASDLSLSWRRTQIKQGFCFRAESFFNFATYMDEVGSPRGISLHKQSHGESFLAAFDRYLDTDESIYLLDEPEAALSPARQLALLRILYDLSVPRRGQFIIATHSPIVLAFPGASVLWFDETGITPVEYRETEHYRLTKRFLNDPDSYFKTLFADE